MLPKEGGREWEGVAQGPGVCGGNKRAVSERQGALFLIFVTMIQTQAPALLRFFRLPRAVASAHQPHMGFLSAQDSHAQCYFQGRVSPDLRLFLSSILCSYITSSLLLSQL